MEWYLKVVKDNYSNFKGRARRKEYWMFVLFNIIFAIVAMILDNILSTTFKISSGYSEVAIPYGWIYLIYMLGVLIPGLAVAVRRLHDVGKSRRMDIYCIHSDYWCYMAVSTFLHRRK